MKALRTTKELIEVLKTKVSVAPTYDHTGKIRKVGKNGGATIEELAREAYGIASGSNVAKMRNRVPGMVRQAIPLRIVLGVNYGRLYNEAGEPYGHHKIKGVKIYDPATATPEDKEMLEQNLARFERRRAINAKQYQEIKNLAGL